MSPSNAPTVPGYDVLAPLGGGATSTVWRGRRLTDGMAVALKVVRPVRGDVDAALREAGLLAAVRHRHVVHLYDVLPLPAEEPGGPRTVVLVTQLAAGGSLAQLLSRRRILSPGELVTVLQPLAGALADLHLRGVVHGDLSTGNVLFRADGMPLLADLGTARVAGERGGAWGTGSAEGMVAPEVLEGFAATAESDVYQLGALARLALTGAEPGPGHDRVPLEEAAPDLDAGLVALVQRCMAPQPEDRPDAEELATVLMGVAEPEPVEVAPDADPAHGLTRRLRQLAQEDAEAVDEEVPRRWWQLRRPGRPLRRPGLRRPGRRRDELVGGGDPPARAPGAHRGEPVKGRAGSGSSLWAVAGIFLVSAVVGAVLFLAVGGPVRTLLAGGGVGEEAVGAQGGEAVGAQDADAATVSGKEGPEVEAVAGDGGDAVADEGVLTAGTAAGSPEAGSGASDAGAGGAGAGRAGADDAASSAGPPRSRVQEDVQAVVDARASAWEATDPALLVNAVAADSPALAADTEELERAQEGEFRYPHVAFTVQDVEVVEREGERLRVAATVVRAALEVRDAEGWLLRTPEQTDQVELELIRQDGRWLLWSWTDEVR